MKQQVGYEGMLGTISFWVGHYTRPELLK